MTIHTTVIVRSFTFLETSSWGVFSAVTGPLYLASFRGPEAPHLNQNVSVGEEGEP